MASSDLQPIYAVRADAVPVLITAFELEPGHFRIRLGRGIGWAPERYTTREQVLRKLLAMRSYTAAEAKACKAICRPTPFS